MEMRYHMTYGKNGWKLKFVTHVNAAALLGRASRQARYRAVSARAGSPVDQQKEQFGKHSK
jgi:hypothetical protein